MRSILTMYLLVTGTLTVLALAVPGLVVVGLFALIIPGLILMIAPTAFFDGALFALAWIPLRARLGAWLAPVAGLALMGAVVLGVPAAINADVGRMIADAQRADRDPDEPARPLGVLRIEQDRSAITVERTGDKRPTYACDDLCAAALFTPGITAVIAASAEVTPTRRQQTGPQAAALRGPMVARVLASRSPADRARPNARGRPT